MTIKRDEAVHFCPEPPNAPATAASIATCKSASSAITKAFLLPISNWQRTKFGAVAAATLRPVGTEPVKLTASMSLELMSASPTEEPPPRTKLKVPSGMP